MSSTTKTCTTKLPSVGDKVKVENTKWIPSKATYIVVSDCHPAVGVQNIKGGPVLYATKSKCKVVGE